MQNVYILGSELLDIFDETVDIKLNDFVPYKISLPVSFGDSCSILYFFYWYINKEYSK